MIYQEVQGSVERKKLTSVPRKMVASGWQEGEAVSGEAGVRA